MPDARATADRYVEIATADGKDKLATLFTEDAVFYAPDGAVYRGRDDIAAFYRRHLANVVPGFHIHRAVPEGEHCWIELADGPADAPRLLASNHFTVDNDGFISGMAARQRWLDGGWDSYENGKCKGKGEGLCRSLSWVADLS